MYLVVYLAFSLLRIHSVFKFYQLLCSSKAKRPQSRKARHNPSPLRDDIINGEGGTKAQNAPDDYSASSQLDIPFNSIAASADNINMDAELLEKSSFHGGDIVVHIVVNTCMLMTFILYVHF